MLNVSRCKCLSCVFSFHLVHFVSSQGKSSVFVESGLDLRLYKCLNIICMCMTLLLVLGYFILVTKQCSENMIDDFTSDNCLSFFNLMHFSSGAS
uniref:Secreted protein n=1 Tax=Ixodes ricinus TaxID=34613 RepID=A0A6B0U3I0_IXORI